ncbi:ADP-ribosyl cyclase/cyclic ADP-ribose hydrolase [Citrus sinensis]|uniref:ADP-ribosyl cyclase/cyclic ADP-ribose hydrolase n=1 Tax=Citrus sinensis TaxID=2711 RepID=A0ACB8M883_CITSI|nr:ADP-ribosyl cyclase/cyclic ADP-ribose hydrolase [Citrus sinensis]
MHLLSIILIIDDVADVEQLQKLVGRRDWFGPGNKIIMTTRDRQLLVAHEVDEEHILDLDVLNNDEALQLFSMKAFKSHQPMGEYVELSKRVLEYAGGLPLALKVLGSFLIGRSADLWRSALERLKKDPSNKIMSILQISFEGLQDSDKKIFLDVACFFKWKNRDYVTKILKGCRFSPVIGIEVLIEKSLLTVNDDNILHMHDLLQELGQLIVTRQSPEEPGKRSRLWKKEEVRQVLIENTPLNMLRVLKLSHSVNLIKTPDFTKVPNLEVLDLKGCKRLREIHQSLLRHNKLILLNLKGCTSLTTLSSEIFMESLEKLVLSGCSKLKKFPDIVGSMECLSVLLLDGTAIEELPLSIERLSKLVLLDLNNCKNLKSLPRNISGLKSLSTLNLSGTSKFREFPEITGRMEHLSNLHLEGTAIRELPVSIELLSGLVLLNLKDCRNLSTLPITVSSLKCLRTLKLSGCSKIVKFPESVISMEDLSELFLDRTSITEVPSSIELLTKLRLLNLNDCRTLVRLPSSINGLKSLKTLNLLGCFKLENVPATLGQVKSLKKLDISGTTINLMRRSSDPVALSLPSSLSDVLKLNEHRLPSLSLYCVDCSKLTGNYALALSLLEEYIKNSEAMSDHVFLCYKNSDRISKVEFSSPSGLELKRCGLHPIYVHEGDKFNQTIGPVGRLNEFWINILNDDLDRAEGSGSCCGDDAGSTASSKQSFLKRSLEGYVGAAEASGSGCCNDDEEPQPKRFRQLE